MTYKDPAKLKAKNAEYNKNNKVQISAQKKVYYDNIISLSLSMIISGIIDDPKIWNLFCNKKRQGANQYNQPFSDDFTDEIFFEKMKDGCFYCGDLADTIDRIDSNIGHTPDNCMGCCQPCNFSKGNGDTDSFIRKAYYRARGNYFDDMKDIWSDNKTKPYMSTSIKKSQKQQRPFTLSQDEWDTLIIADCVYCHRSRPINKWNGVDRVIPDNGYTSDNSVACCHDCNNDKGKLSVEDMKKRNKKIANRLEKGIIVLSGCEKSLLNKGDKGKKVCVYGKVYPSYEIASKALIKRFI
jgi:hypothetical protein